jgi:hypothetical protein
MAHVTSSTIGVSLSDSSSTQLFALGTTVFGTDGTQWQYVEATSTFTTGQLVLVNEDSTAKNFTTALLAAPGVNGLDIGAAQFTVSQGEFAFVAKRGENLYVLCTGTIAAGTGVALGANGRLQAMAAAAAGGTLGGIHITTSASTATASVAIATFTFPRGLLTTGYIA